MMQNTTYTISDWGEKLHFELQRFE